MPSPNDWFFWASLSAGFAAMTAILAKVGVEGVDADYATFVRTVVEDVDALRTQLRSAKVVEGTRIEDNVPTSFGGKNGVYRVFAVRPPWAGIRQFGAERGEFLTDEDVDTSARVCLLGQTVARELFGKVDPIGQEVSINQVPFHVKGVLVAKGASPAEGDREARIVIPVTTFYDRLYSRRNTARALRV